MKFLMVIAACFLFTTPAWCISFNVPFSCVVENSQTQAIVASDCNSTTGISTYNTFGYGALSFGYGPGAFDASISIEYSFNLSNFTDPDQDLTAVGIFSGEESLSQTFIITGGTGNGYYTGEPAEYDSTGGDYTIGGSGFGGGSFTFGVPFTLTLDVSWYQQIIAGAFTQRQGGAQFGTSGGFEVFDAAGDPLQDFDVTEPVPTPEPGTLALMGVGLFMCWRGLRLQVAGGRVLRLRTATRR